MDIILTHKELLALMKKFDEICLQNDIHYTLHGGSLLGAIREQGFIPWDDDMDVAMTRYEFNRLRNILNDSKEYDIFGDIKSQFRYKKDSNFWIDIFICDYIGTGYKGKIKNLLLTVLDVMNRNADTIKLANFAQYSKSKRIVYMCIYYFGKIFPTGIKVRWYLKISEFCFCGNKTIMHRSNDQYKGRKEEFPADWMSCFQYITFEDTKLSVMKNYHEMLVKCYGEDYMTPIKDKRSADVHNIVRRITEKGI